MSKKAKVLVIDIETAPLVSYTWGLFDQNIGLNQIHKDWHLLAFAAKWLDEPASKIVYMDQRKEKHMEDDKKLLSKIWKLLDEADIVLTQNGKKFDVKKINARLIQQGFSPPSSFRQIDTLVIAKKHFGFTSNKLEYMTKKLCTKYKKLSHTKFSGFELWKECLAGNIEAWKEMEVYNKHDVLSLEELYHKLQPWDNSINFSLYTDAEHMTCSCGSDQIFKNGTKKLYSNASVWQRYRCANCGAEFRGAKKLLDKQLKETKKVPVRR